MARIMVARPKRVPAGAAVAPGAPQGAGVRQGAWRRPVARCRCPPREWVPGPVGGSMEMNPGGMKQEGPGGPGMMMGGNVMMANGAPVIRGAGG